MVLASEIDLMQISWLVVGPSIFCRKRVEVAGDHPPGPTDAAELVSWDQIAGLYLHPEQNYEHPCHNLWL